VDFTGAAEVGGVGPFAACAWRPCATGHAAAQLGGQADDRDPAARVRCGGVTWRPHSRCRCPA